MAELYGRWRAIARSEPVTIALLLGANLVPLVGVFFFDWDVFSVLFLYWLENGVVGVLNVPRILLAARNPHANEGTGSALARAISFPLHYGWFWLGHGLFVFVLAGGALSRGRLDIGGSLASALSEPALVLAALALIVSHVSILWFNYVGRQEFLRTTPKAEQMRPYPRMIVLHMTIVLGGLAIALVGRPAALVALLVVGKTVLDLSLHFKERARAKATAAPLEVPAPAVTV